MTFENIFKAETIKENEHKSDDEKYMELIGGLRNKLDFLADKIKTKIYEYEFLKNNNCWQQCIYDNCFLSSATTHILNVVHKF